MYMYVYSRDDRRDEPRRSDDRDRRDDRGRRDERDAPAASSSAGGGRSESEERRAKIAMWNKEKDEAPK
jgi:hypothetical protein